MQAEKIMSDGDIALGVGVGCEGYRELVLDEEATREIGELALRDEISGQLFVVSQAGLVKVIHKLSGIVRDRLADLGAAS